MNETPAEIFFQIALYLPYWDVYNFWKVSLRNCLMSWGLWKKKALLDFDVSSSLFDLYRKKDKICGIKRYYEFYLRYNFTVSPDPNFTLYKYGLSLSFFLSFYWGKESIMEELLPKLGNYFLTKFLDVNNTIAIKRSRCIEVIEKKLGLYVNDSYRELYLQVESLIKKKKFPALYSVIEKYPIHPYDKFDILSQQLISYSEESFNFLLTILFLTEDVNNKLISFANLLSTGNIQRINRFLEVLEKRDVKIEESIMNSEALFVFAGQERPIQAVISSMAYISNNPIIIEKYGKIYKLSSDDKFSYLMTGYYISPNNNIYDLFEKEKITWKEEYLPYCLLMLNREVYYLACESLSIEKNFVEDLSILEKNIESRYF